MAYTDSDKIKAIIEVDETLAPSLTPFIDAAHELVEECCSEAGYTESRLTIIETWLAAHFYAILSPRTTGERAGSVGETFQSSVALGLNVTHYGQQAMRLDTAGGLAALENQTKKGLKPAIDFAWLGTKDC